MTTTVYGAVTVPERPKARKTHDAVMQSGDDGFSVRVLCACGRPAIAGAGDFSDTHRMSAVFLFP